MENYLEREKEERYSVEISLDAEGSVEKIELRGEKSSLWKRIIEINMKRLQVLNLHPGREGYN